MSYNIKNALATSKRRFGRWNDRYMKDSTRTLEKTKKNGFFKLSLKMQRTSICATACIDEKMVSL